MEAIELGGVRQAVWIRGRDARAPALILLHGGPGASEAALFRHYTATLEDHFVVIYWEQRGTGRSYHQGVPPASMRIESMLADPDELVDTVRTRVGTDHVVLLGHAWGTILGTLYARDHPEKLAAYVGVAPFAVGERVSLAWALRAAELRGDARASTVLRAMTPALQSVAEERALGRWMEHLGGSFRSGLSTRKILWAALRTDEASLVDLVKGVQGERFSREALRPEYSRADLTRIRHFVVPVVFMLGRHDWHTPSVLAANYFATIDAPAKRLIWLEASAHNPPFEEPGKFVRAMLDHVQPLAREASPGPACTAARGPASSRSSSPPGAWRAATSGLH